tara:strand:- start:276 stop:458 length:183 start_codon:yes stop_codon:yes gene_type:complete
MAGLGDVVNLERAITRISENTGGKKNITHEKLLGKIETQINPQLTADLYNPKVSDGAVGN